MGGEPACCFVLSFLCFNYVILLFLIFTLVLLGCFFVVLPVASAPGRVQDSDPMGAARQRFSCRPGVQRIAASVVGL